MTALAIRRYLAERKKRKDQDPDLIHEINGVGLRASDIADLLDRVEGIPMHESSPPRKVAAIEMAWHEPPDDTLDS